MTRAPRNQRPRDRAGRPLPYGAEGVPRVPDDLALPPTETLVEAQRLLDDGLPFSAHEVLEAAWKAAPESERALWRGLAQLAVGLTHVQRGNPRGARALLERGATSLEPYAAPAPYGVAAPAPYEIAVDELRAWALAAATALDQAPPMPRLVSG